MHQVAPVSGRNLSYLRGQRIFYQSFSQYATLLICVKNFLASVGNELVQSGPAQKSRRKQIIHRTQRAQKIHTNITKASLCEQKISFCLLFQSVSSPFLLRLDGFREAHRGAQRREKSSSFSHYLCIAPTRARAVPLLSSTHSGHQYSICALQSPRHKKAHKSFTGQF